MCQFGERFRGFLIEQCGGNANQLSEHTGIAQERCESIIAGESEVTLCDLESIAHKQDIAVPSVIAWFESTTNPASTPEVTPIVSAHLARAYRRWANDPSTPYEQIARNALAWGAFQNLGWIGIGDQIREALICKGPEGCIVDVLRILTSIRTTPAQESARLRHAAAFSVLDPTGSEPPASGVAY